MTEPLLRARDLRIGFGDRQVVHGISFTVDPGECLAIVGESGSGKSVTARTLIGLTGPGSTVRAEALEFRGTALPSRESEWKRLRGKNIGFILQDALVSLDPLRPVGREIEEALSAHGYGTRATRRARVIELLRLAGVPQPELRARQRADELSGGLRQRALIAAALAMDPPLLIADEPTTALDATVAARILDVLADAKRRGKAIVLISHDLSVVARLADRVAVMRGGEFVETGSAAEVLDRPRHEYTRSLLDAIPSGISKGTLLVDRSRPAPAAAPAPGAPPALVARGLRKIFPAHGHEQPTGVQDVGFELAAGSTLGIVGESGSGKTTTARMVLGLLRPDSGTVELNGSPWSELPDRAKRARRHEISVIYQDALSSFDPRWTVWRILRDAVEAAGVPRAERDERIDELLAQVQLDPSVRDRRPLRLSGGQRQRVAIARALAGRPSVIVCDEPVSALDVSVQARVLDLLTTLQARTGVALVFISHDLGVIHHMSDQILVMKDGVVVERGDADRVFDRPEHPYTRTLLDAIPRTAARAPAA
ncbi:ABC transporter ATP-binding protein [Nocardia sp. BMG51109]|uniref:dipeptide ABC transporter ATP-binding protein n=1 Tax=Nocardia sp. BMG51109 TaxID=1056816 RepID=UPI0004633A4D|nr:ABC transporter ATP-binding protein [Nocardia sp. BMG51109]